LHTHTGITPEALNAYNKPYIAGITVNSKLLRGTLVRIPPRQPELVRALPPPPPLNPDLSLRALQPWAAELMLGDFEAIFKAVFFGAKSGVKLPKAAAEGGVGGLEVQEAPVVKFRKSQRFFLCKVPHRLLHVGRLLQNLIKHQVWAQVCVCGGGGGGGVCGAAPHHPTPPT